MKWKDEEDEIIILDDYFKVEMVNVKTKEPLESYIVNNNRNQHKWYDIIEAERYENFVPIQNLTKQKIKSIYKAKRIAIQKKNLIPKKIRSL